MGETVILASKKCSPLKWAAGQPPSHCVFVHVHVHVCACACG
jgi:hypothetical protein